MQNLKGNRTEEAPWALSVGMESNIDRQHFVFTCILALLAKTPRVCCHFVPSGLLDMQTVSVTCFLRALVISLHKMNQHGCALRKSLKFEATKKKKRKRRSTPFVEKD